MRTAKTLIRLIWVLRWGTCQKVCFTRCVSCYHGTKHEMWSTTYWTAGKNAIYWVEFWVELLTIEPKHTYTKISLRLLFTMCVPLTNKNQTARLYENQITVIYSRAVMSECLVKGVICKTWTVALANSADLDQMLQNVASDQGLHCCLNYWKLRVEWKFFSPRLRPFSQPTLRDISTAYYPLEFVWILG